MLVVLRRIDENVSRLAGDMRDIEVRVTNLEEGQAAANRRLDPMEGRLDGIERRLDLVEPAPR